MMIFSKLLGQLTTCEKGSFMPVINDMNKILESVGDATVDNLVDQLHISTSIELEKFVCELLSRSLNQFMTNYKMPLYDDFRTSFKAVLNRYQLMDGDQAGDLHKKIQIMMTSIFSEKFSANGHEVADVMAAKFSTQMINFLKYNRIQKADTTVDKTDAYY